MTSIRNAFTVDVEDYFQVSALSPYITRGSWDRRACRVERNLDELLGLLEHFCVRATFFPLGWIAQRYPQAIQRIVEAGHELASHGYSHLRASEQTPGEFRTDVDRAKKLLEDLAGVEVVGYRAPSFSIGAGNLWALRVLEECGYRYSSSIYPIRHDHYGMPSAPRFQFVPDQTQQLLEVPATTFRLWSHNLPAAGGGYFRLFPYALSKYLIERINKVDGRPSVFYCHPWELDPDQPRPAAVDLKTRFRHYLNLSRTKKRLGWLLQDFHWGRMDEIFLSASR